MEIDYPQGHQVVFGNSLTPVDTKQSPVVKFVPSSPDDDAARTHYTLIMVSDVSLVRYGRTQMSIPSYVKPSQFQTGLFLSLLKNDRLIQMLLHDKIENLATGDIG